MPSSTRSARILIITGEASGDLHGANLAAALKAKAPGILILGVGGPRMQAAGVELVQSLGHLNVIGIAGPSAVRALATDAKVPCVLDADALRALSPVQAGHPAWTGLKSRAVLTPHPGEMAGLLGSTAERVQADRRGASKALALRLGVVVVLKGHGTVVTDGLRVAVNETGNPGMATAGSGDILAGVLAGLLAQGMAAFEAARLGVHLHGLAGDLAAREKGQHALIATDILEALPAAFLKQARS